MNVDSPTELGLINQRESNIQHRLLSVDASCQNAIKNYKVWWCRTFIQCSMKILEGLFQKSSINPNNPARLRNKVTLRIFQTETPALALLKARGPLGPHLYRPLSLSYLNRQWNVILSGYMFDRAKYASFYD